MSSIYSEAIAEARKLKEIAEQNAKNKIIESITPRIRMLIEQELTSEEDEMQLDDIEEEDLDDSEISSEDNEYQEDLPVEDFPPQSSPTFDYESDIELVDPMQVEYDESEESEIAKDKNVNINITVESKRVRRTRLLRRKATQLVLKLREAKTNKTKKLILKELNKIRSVLSIKTLVERKLNKEILEVIKETNMSRSTRRPTSRLNKNNRRRLSEAEEEEEELDLDLEDEAEEEEVEEDLDLGEEGDEDIDMEAIRSAIEELAAEVGLNIEEEVEEEEVEEEAEEADEEEDLDAGYAADENYMVEAEEVEESLEEADDDEEITINEADLRRAIRSMKTRQTRNASQNRRRSSQSRRRRISEGDARKAASHFGGGKIKKEMFVEVDEETLLNVLAEELGGAHKMQINKEKKEGSASRMARHFGGGTAKVSVIKEARKKVVLAERKALLARRQAIAAKKELKESNLFNAKLLYVNKLMQVHDLNSKQQRAIVEALDNAKTIREAKLLYTSLTDSLRQRNTTTRRKEVSSRLNEGLVKSGSGSNSTRSSAPAKNGVELNRWATLAGIKNKK